MISEDVLGLAEEAKEIARPCQPTHELPRPPAVLFVTDQKVTTHL